jgi:hypothetical protein
MVENIYLWERIRIDTYGELMLKKPARVVSFQKRDRHCTPACLPIPLASRQRIPKSSALSQYLSQRSQTVCTLCPLTCLLLQRVCSSQPSALSLAIAGASSLALVLANHGEHLPKLAANTVCSVCTRLQRV